MNYILSNIFFGQPKISKFQLEWFHNYFIPLIQKRGTPEDKIIIVGDIFYNTININFSLLKDVKKIFKSITLPIEIIGNDYCFDIIKDFAPMTKNETSFFDNMKTNLFDSKENSNSIGFYVIREGNIKFVENKLSPRFINFEINSLEDLDKIKINNNFADVIINAELMKVPEFKNKIEIFLSKNKFDNIYYKDVEKEKTKIVVKNSNIKNIIMDNLEDDLKEEMINIFKLCEK